ncbi:MAG: FIST C-terminal domain-containing protein [Rhodospirillales bacterium]|nr:FIST C-terminal domain-containing protein [Rhodospirillales bacterium]
MFASSSAAGETWEAAVEACLSGLPQISMDANLGIVYVTEHLAPHFSEITERIKSKTGVDDWVGAAGLGVCASGVEYFDQPAIAVMVLDLPPGGYRLFSNADDAAAPGDGPSPQSQALTAPPFVVVHGDSNNQKLFEDLETISDATGGYLVGGLTASETRNHQIAGSVTGGGVSGVVFAPEVAVLTSLSQGCTPIGAMHRIDEANENILIKLDGESALEVFRRDIGEVLARDVGRAAGFIHAALPVKGSDTGDYLVRNVVGIDEEQGILAIAETVAHGDSLMFVSRDPNAARTDLTTMLERLKKRAGAEIKGAHYISCIARGPNMFGELGAELELVQATIGDIPLVGMYANGEISNNRIYSYTGVLTLFV